jgi:hypothetical protein
LYWKVAPRFPNGSSTSVQLAVMFTDRVLRTSGAEDVKFITTGALLL